jgi:metal-sulfur cluster biosynthetic enzyme
VESLSLIGEVRQALSNVMDPHFQISLDDMGMVSGVEVEDGVVMVKLVIPCMGCPAFDDIQIAVHDELGHLSGVREVRVVPDWEAPWSASSISSFGRSFMQSYGVQL